MKGSGRQTPRNEIDLLLQRIKKLEDDVKLLKNNQTPTLPIYDPDNFPAVSVEGQVAVGINGKLYRYLDGAWGPVAGIDFDILNLGDWFNLRTNGATGITIEDVYPTADGSAGVTIVSDHNSVTLQGRIVNIGPNWIVAQRAGISFDLDSSSDTSVGVLFAFGLTNTWSIFRIVDSSGNAMLEAHGDGSLHLRTGTDWVADLP